MQYRPFGKLDWQTSALGFGCARFPVVEEQYTEIERTPVEGALQWLWDQPEASVVLSGMSTMEQVEISGWTTRVHAILGKDQPYPG